MSHREVLNMSDVLLTIFVKIPIFILFCYLIFRGVIYLVSTLTKLPKFLIACKDFVPFFFKSVKAQKRDILIYLIILLLSFVCLALFNDMFDALTFSFMILFVVFFFFILFCMLDFSEQHKLPSRKKRKTAKSGSM